MNVLEQLVKKQKTAAIVQNFARKVRRSNIYSPPVEFSKFNEESSGSIFDLQGFTLNPKLETLLNLLLVLQITCLSVVYTLSLVFPDVEHSSFVGSLQLASTILYCLEMVVEFLTIKISAGRKLTLFAEIWEYYRVNGFWIDLANFLCLILDIALDNGYTKYMRLLVVVKIPQCLGRV